MSRATQADRILALLQAHEGEWVPLPRILGLYIGQYNARIYELRAEGFEIENRREWTGDGQVHSFYRLMLTYRGLRKPVSWWADILGLSPSTVHKRLKHWPIEKALTFAGVIDPHPKKGQLELLRTA